MTPPAVLGRGQGARIVSGCLVIALASLAVPATLAYDAWAWLIWGREVGHLALDTTGGPSWKPLPVLLATPIAPLGSLAPTTWLVVARTVGLLAIVGTYRLGRRLAGPAAGVVAAGLLVLTPDPGPRFLRLVLEGHSAPVTAGLAVWAVERHLAHRTATTFVLLGLLSLDRPEAWPFLAAYGLWWAARTPQVRTAVVAGGALVPVLWFGGDWLGSGSPWHGADTAQVIAMEQGRLGAAVRRAWAMVIAPAWIAALAGLAREGWRRAGTVGALVGLATAWAGLVVAMSAGLGYAAVARFFLPAAALVCVAAAVAVVRWITSFPSGPWRVLAGTAVALLAVPATAGRLANLPGLLDEVEDRARSAQDLEAAVHDAGGLGRTDSCATLFTDTGAVPVVALAWFADVPMHEVRSARRASELTGTVVARSGSRLDRRLATEADVVALARHGVWAVYRAPCAAGVENQPDASGSRAPN